MTENPKPPEDADVSDEDLEAQSGGAEDIIKSKHDQWSQYH